MFFNKRTPAFWLGFFFFLLFPFCAGARENVRQADHAVPAGEAGFSVAAEAGTILVTDDGSAAYWRSGLDFSLGPKFYLDVDLGRVSSGLPALDGSLFLFREKFGFNAGRWGLGFSTGVLSHGTLNVETENISLSSDGGQGAFLGIEAPVHVGPLTVVPSFSFGKASWDEGELYWFLGRPDVPSARLWGLSARLEHSAGNTGRMEHELSFRFFRADLKIVSNEREHLFDSELGAGLLSYRCSLETGGGVFSGTLGWIRAAASLEGALTASNQHYFFFPYLFYNVNGSVEADAGFAALGFVCNPGIFRCEIDLGAFHVFSADSGGAAIHYKQKNLFGGDEVFEERSLDPGGIGAAFLRLEAALPALPAGAKGRRLFLGLEKIFVIPWGTENFLSAGENSGAAGEEVPEDRNLSLVRTALLSGLFFRASFSW